MQVRRAILGIVAAAALGGCAVSPDPNSLTWDPFEEQNRGIHEVNKDIDRQSFGPLARAYGTFTPDPVRGWLTNLHYNWKHPAYVIDYTLQGRPGLAATSATRFLVNTLLGLGGVLDIATDMGIEFRETNIDEVMYVWGVPEGGYVEIPFGGPGTQRDWSGWVLDIALDPMFYVLPVTAANTLVGLGAVNVVNDRYELDPVVDELLYRSSDSYTATRISYLQNMRARLQGGVSVEQLEDVYADF